MAKAKSSVTSQAPVHSLTPKQFKDLLDEAELQNYQESVYQPGYPLQWVLTFGWCIIGFYVKHVTPISIRVAHANFFHNAHKDYGLLCQEGGSPETEWRYLGNTEISFQHVVHVEEYYGEVPRQRVST